MTTAVAPREVVVRDRPWWFAPIIVAWLVVAFVAAFFGTRVLVLALFATGIDEATLGSDVFGTLVSVILYVVLLAIILGLSRLIRLWPRGVSVKRLVGLTRLLEWKDLGLAVIGFAVMFALAIGLTIVASLIPGFDAGQTQDIGFSKTLQPGTSTLVFLLLVVAAPVAEELIFRGYLFGALRRTVPLWVAALITSILFGIVHFQWNVGIQVFALSMVSCYLRAWTGSLWASIVLHMLKNGVAFYFLYIAGSLMR